MELQFQHWRCQRSGDGLGVGKILLLHGLGGTGALWRPVAAGLESDFSILAPDQRGHGGSRPVPPDPESGLVSMAPEDYARDVAGLMARLQFRPVVAVGHSMGARTAAVLAELEPTWVRACVLVDLGLERAGQPGRGLRDFLESLPAEFPSRPELRAYLEARCPDKSIAQYLMAVSRPAESGVGVFFPFERDRLVETIDAAQSVDLRESIRKFVSFGPEKKVLLLRGALSRVWSSEAYQRDREALKDLGPSVVFEEFEGAGHGLPFEKRPEFVARLRAFVAGRFDDTL